ncbi:GDSL-type esterase/lipase family protein [Streptomyces sp. NBC_01795]|uniref:SGNH/GDSL hydrolase family protein n=1 Tax=Streptomyces sp. NBC_01795 TaxID=2975943 RepID=UPI002DD96546|nr:SGNH/GDSL hydrolase family protein [Streptomyces sp. NBC_01795]WSA94960.1 GDSL-type esterase/lipase family protein [Streptomyces sp. NBC_01795]
MTESHHTGSDRSKRPHPSGRLRPRTVTISAFAAILVAGLVLALVHGSSSDGGSGKGAQRAESSARPHAKPQRIWDRSPGSIAAVGDSITRGFDACSLLSDCTKVSWATGTENEVDSLASRLLTDPRGKSWNYAVSGAVADDLPAQMRKAADVRPGMVTVMSGANDACRPSVARMTPVEDFRADIREGLRVLRAESPKTQVYVSSVPDLRRLWQQGRKNPIGERVWGLGICQSMLKDPQSMDKAAHDRRQQVYDRAVDYNSVLKEECAKDLRCRYDNGAVFRYRFTGAELSNWDWFHPSKAGQRSLAEMAYRQIVARRPTG